MAEKTVLISQQYLKAIKILKWKVSEGSSLSIGRVILLYDFEGAHKVEQRKLKSTQAGTIRRIIAQEDAIIRPGEPLLELAACIHPTIMKDMCAECGADLRKDDLTTTASVPMVHAIPELKVSEELAQKLGKADGDRLLKDRKLVLLVDLDQTIIHTTNDNIPPNIKDVYHFQLYGPQSPWYHTRLRPGTHDFLKNVSPLFELHICTFGARNYAHTITTYLDADSSYFSNRILSRDECFDPTSKKANLKALFPCGDNMVCIIDDREDVWSHASNLIHVKPYHFFQHTGDINAPPGLDKQENDEKQSADWTRMKIKSKKKFNGTNLKAKTESTLANSSETSKVGSEEMDVVEENTADVAQLNKKEGNKTAEGNETAEGSETAERNKTEEDKTEENKTDEDKTQESKTVEASNKEDNKVAGVNKTLEENKIVEENKTMEENKTLKENNTMEENAAEEYKPKAENKTKEHKTTEENKATEENKTKEDNKTVEENKTKEGNKTVEENSTIVTKTTEESKPEAKQIAGENRSTKKSTNGERKVEDNNKELKNGTEILNLSVNKVSNSKKGSEPRKEVIGTSEDRNGNADLEMKLDQKDCENEDNIQESTDKKAKNAITENVNNTDVLQNEEAKLVHSEKMEVDEPMLEPNKEDDLIEVEDTDDYLIYLEDILKRIHKTFYEEFDKMESGAVPDLKRVIPAVRSTVLKGAKLVFSGLVPTHIKLEQSKAYQVALSLGAVITQDIMVDTTHLVAVRPGTAKVNAGRRKKKLKIVTPDWLWACAERWEHLEEKIYPLSSKGSKNRHPPPHVSPEHVPNYPVHDAPGARKRTASGRFMDTINPLMSFSSDDIADMDKEVDSMLLDEESDTEDEANKTTKKVLKEKEEGESSSSSSESLTGEYPRGFKRLREKSAQREMEEELHDSSLDEYPSAKFRRGEKLDSDLDIGQESNSEGSVEAPDEVDDGEWNMMGAALEREFLANN